MLVYLLVQFVVFDDERNIYISQMQPRLRLLVTLQKIERPVLSIFEYSSQ